MACANFNTCSTPPPTNVAFVITTHPFDGNSSTEKSVGNYINEKKYLKNFVKDGNVHKISQK